MNVLICLGNGRSMMKEMPAVPHPGDMIAMENGASDEGPLAGHNPSTMYMIEDVVWRFKDERFGEVAYEGVQVMCIPMVREGKVRAKE